jgi:hypothetical protein
MIATAGGAGAGMECADCTQAPRSGSRAGRRSGGRTGQAACPADRPAARTFEPLAPMAPGTTDTMLSVAASTPPHAAAEATRAANSKHRCRGRPSGPPSGRASQRLSAAAACRPPGRRHGVGGERRTAVARVGRSARGAFHPLNPWRREPWPVLPPLAGSAGTADTGHRGRRRAGRRRGGPGAHRRGSAVRCGRRACDRAVAARTDSSGVVARRRCPVAAGQQGHRVNSRPRRAHHLDGRGRPGRQRDAHRHRARGPDRARPGLDSQFARRRPAQHGNPVPAAEPETGRTRRGVDAGAARLRAAGAAGFRAHRPPG